MVRLISHNAFAHPCRRCTADTFPSAIPRPNGYRGLQVKSSKKDRRSRVRPGDGSTDQCCTSSIKPLPTRRHSDWPFVWTGRALQAGSDDLESWSYASVSGLLMEPLSSWP